MPSKRSEVANIFYTAVSVSATTISTTAKRHLYELHKIDRRIDVFISYTE